MATYVRIRSADGSNAVMIDDTFRNMELSSAGTAATSMAWSPTSLRQASLTVTGASDPMVAVASTTASALLSRVSNGGGSFTFNIVFNATADLSFNYYIFDNPNNAAPPDYLVIRDTSNNIIFSAGEKYMRVAGVMDTAAGSGASISKTFTAGKTYAVMHGHVGFTLIIVVGAIEPGGGTPERWQQVIDCSAQMTRVVGSTVYTDYVAAYHFSQAGGPGGMPPGGGTFGGGHVFSLVLDVTNFQ